VAHDIFSIIQHGVRVEAGFSLRADVIGWRESYTTGGTVSGRVVLCQFPRANNRIFAANDPASGTMNTENDSKIKKEA